MRKTYFLFSSLISIHGPSRNTLHCFQIVSCAAIYKLLNRIYVCTTHICFCEQPRGYQGLSQLRTQQEWFLLTDPPKELGLHHVVHKYLNCICTPQPFLINHVFCGLYVLHTLISLLCGAPTAIYKTQLDLVQNIYPLDVQFVSHDLFHCLGIRGEKALMFSFIRMLLNKISDSLHSSAILVVSHTSCFLWRPQFIT